MSVLSEKTVFLTNYAQIMSTLKAGDMIDIVVVRDDKKVTLKAKLE